ncbi:MAG: hypothetical protein H3C26_20885 [Rhodocyclaceae bacterium]|nr:hypothetical protein [Rhodocyclaceae bacterium]
MGFPAFFDAVPGIVLRDPLAELLGAADGGLIEYRYADAVRLAGHSCPTVAGAWLLTARALRALYGDAIPERGGIRVDFGEPLESGVAGVVAGIAGLLTGAAGGGGFKGLGGRHARRNLLQFDVAEVDGIRFGRLDGQGAVVVALDLSPVPGDPRMGELLPLVLQGAAGAEERTRFGELWQERVRRILVDHHDDPRLTTIVRV